LPGGAERASPGFPGRAAGWLGVYFSVKATFGEKAMQKRNSRRFVLIWGLLLVLTATFALAQTDSDETSDDEQAASKQRTASAEKDGVVYTTNYLKERFGEKDDAAPAEDSDETLIEETAEVPPGAFTNEDLKQRFGSDEEAAPETDEDAAPETDEDAAEVETEVPAEPETAAEPAEPALSPEERAQLISEIDDEIERLDKRLLALKNPLLAGTVPPTPEEQTEEAGLGNAERLRRTEEKIDELKTTLEELRSEPEAPRED